MPFSRRGSHISKQKQEPPSLCLLDDRTRTLLVFHPTGEHQWSLEVRGDLYLWDRVLAVYQQWLTLQRPLATAYRIAIDAQGKQTLTLPHSSVPGSVPTWIIPNTLERC
jgi:hypothetical protein